MDRMEELLSRLGDLIADLVEQHVWTIMAARTHGQQAVPTTFGAKLAVVLAECTRNRERLGQLRPRISKVSLLRGGWYFSVARPSGARDPGGDGRRTRAWCG